ncbi:RCC1 domain-containing protein [Pyxidicoccus sp. 3LG]
MRKDMNAGWCALVLGTLLVMACSQEPVPSEEGASREALSRQVLRVVPTATPVRLATGAQHTLYLSATGTVWAWGGNSAGQLGAGSMSFQRLTPAPVPGVSDGVSVAAGDSHSLVLRGDGTVWAWGSNSSGQLGDGTTTDRATPQPVPGLMDVVGWPRGTSTRWR